MKTFVLRAHSQMEMEAWMDGLKRYAEFAKGAYACCVLLWWCCVDCVGAFACVVYSELCVCVVSLFCVYYSEPQRSDPVL